MKPRYSTANLALRCLPAALLAVHLSAGTAWAQSALSPPDDADSRLRLDLPSSTSDRNSGNRNSTDSNDTTEQDQVSDPDTATTADPDANPDEDKNAALDTATLKELRRQNPREEAIDSLDPKKVEDDELTPGVAVGSFTLRPSISETVGIERTRTGDDVTTRSYLQTGFKGSLVSDWSLHQLKVDTEGTWQKTLSGIPEDEPEGKIEAALRLDITEATKANLKAGYSLQREDISAANAIANATNQAQVSTYTASAELTHDLGLIRGTAGIDFSRETYGDAQLDTGKFVSQKDRNENTAILRGRLGYELSPALIPFLEGSYGRTIYDQHKDTLGYIRDAQLYALKTGLEGDFGEKLRGEISTGYALAEFDDSRLKAISAITFDGNATWSPQRGTDVELGLKTEIEPSTTAGASGDVAYTANAALTQAIIDTLKGRLTASTTWRDYSLSTQPNQKVYDLGAGVTWGISRSIDFNADIAWEKTTQPGTAQSDVFTAGIGLSLKR
ncbi:MAG: hypothetical protein JWM58_2100 [Rhizobium sp.]|nr:hypothetical protein [Rhizobium sp.]